MNLDSREICRLNIKSTSNGRCLWLSLPLLLKLRFAAWAASVCLHFRAGARYTKWIASLELRHKEHSNDPYPLHNNTIDFTQ